MPTGHQGRKTCSNRMMPPPGLQIYRRPCVTLTCGPLHPTSHN